MNTRKKQNSQSGFSIIEVAITIFIIGVTLILFQVTANTVVINRGGRFKEVALRIADQKLQNIRSTNFGLIPASGNFTDPLMSSLPNSSGSINVVEVDSNMKQITVTVSWKSPQGTNQDSINLETFISRGGLGQ